MKANDSEMMLKLAIALGLGFDCASPGEINRIRNFNVSPTSIIYACPAKTPDQMIYARQSGVKHTTFDSPCELEKLKIYWPDAKLLIRIKVDSDSIYKLADKFGCDFDTEAIDLLEKAASLQLNVIGVAFHVGSACSSTDSYVLALHQAKALFDHEAKQGRQMKIVDIGGGFMCDDEERLEEVTKNISETLDQLFPEDTVQVIGEPGRYLCEVAFTLYCNIKNVKRTIHNNKPVNMLYINDGIFGTIEFIEPWHEVYKLNGENEENTEEDTILWGPTGDSKDFKTAKLPPCTPQDWLVFTMLGAYTLTFSTPYCGVEKPLIRPVVSRELWEKIKDNTIFALTDFIFSQDLTAPLPTTLPPLFES